MTLPLLCLKCQQNLVRLGILGDVIEIHITLAGLENRELFFWPRSGRHLYERYICKVPELLKTETFETAEIIAMSRDHALKHFIWIMERFGFDAPESVFKRDQERFFEGRL